jgi:hypothetical protein
MSDYQTIGRYSRFRSSGSCWILVDRFSGEARFVNNKNVDIAIVPELEMMSIENPLPLDRMRDVREGMFIAPHRTLKNDLAERPDPEHVMKRSTEPASEQNGIDTGMSHHARVSWRFRFQRGSRVGSRSQLGLPA